MQWLTPFAFRQTAEPEKTVFDICFSLQKGRSKKILQSNC
jgi:hypothetical protein